MTRRTLWSGLFWAAGALVSLAAGLPLVTLIPRRRTVSERLVSLGRVADMPDGKVVRRPIVLRDVRDAWSLIPEARLGSVWVRRQGNSVEAWSTICPHAGCAVDKNEGAGFSCPCHQSAFDDEGKVVSGPSPRPLDRLEVRLDGGEAKIVYQRFRIGVRDKVLG